MNFLRNVDEIFSLENFKPSQKAVVVNRSMSTRATPSEKSKPTGHTADTARPTKPVFGFNSDLPTQSPEEIVSLRMLARN